MKSLKNYLLEMRQNCEWETVSDKKDLTLERIQNCIGHSSFMYQCSWGTIEGKEYIKLGKNKWQAHSNSSSVLSGTITDKELYDLISTAKEVKFKLLVKE